MMEPRSPMSFSEIGASWNVRGRIYWYTVPMVPSVSLTTFH